MSKLATIAGSNTALLIGASAVALSLVGAGAYFASQDNWGVDGAGTADVEAVAEPQAVASAPAAVEPPQEPPAKAQPRIDEVRVEQDGLTIIAGRAQPGTTVSIRLDGVENTTALVDASGSFAAVTTIAPKNEPQVLSLFQEGASEGNLGDEVILAPVNASAGTEIAAADTNGADTAGLDDQGQALASDDASAPTVASDTVSPQVPAAPVEQVATAASVPPDARLQTSQSPGVEAPSAPDTASIAEAVESPEDRLPDAAASIADLNGPNVAADGEQVKETARAADPVTETGETTLARLENAEAPTPGVDSSEAEPLPEMPVEAATEISGVATPAEPNSAAPTATQSIETLASVDAPDQVALDANAGNNTPAGVSDAPRRVVALRSTEEGVELLSSQAAVPQNVALDTISYSSAGDVQLAGRARPSAQLVRIYLDNVAIATLNVDDAGRWRGELPQVDTGIYTLRVDEVSAEGDVTSRIQTPFKREDPVILAEARRNSLRDAQSVTVQKGDTLWAISRDRYGEGLLYVQVFEANKVNIRDPDLIYPGQVFDLPDN